MNNYELKQKNKLVILLGACILKLGGDFADTTNTNNFIIDYYLNRNLKMKINISPNDKGRIFFTCEETNTFIDATIKNEEEFIRLLQQIQIIPEKL